MIAGLHEIRKPLISFILRSVVKSFLNGIHVRETVKRILLEGCMDMDKTQLMGGPPIYQRIPQKNKEFFRVKVNNYLKLTASLKDVAIDINAKTANDNSHSSKVFAEIFEELIEPSPQTQAEIDFVPINIDKISPKERDMIYSQVQLELK